MSFAYRYLIRPALFLQDSESIHKQVLSLLGAVSRFQPMLALARRIYAAPSFEPIECFGLRFPNPIGLAAGMDKHAQAVPAWAALGFGFSELGGVTWLAQPGNPVPRMFRVPCDRALINRMGFNNPGAPELARTLQTWRHRGLWPSHPVGINLGKSKAAPLDQAAEDYLHSFQCLSGLADFFVVNVSSPNTPNLRQLQDKKALDEILAALQQANGRAGTKRRPILVKVAPDLSFEALDEILELAAPRQLAGIVATNTTVTRPVFEGDSQRRAYSETGGLSGAPLRQRSTEVIRHLYRQSRGSIPIIGVGGIFNPDDAWEKVSAGASLLQVYSGLVYEGPSLARALVRGLRARMEQQGIQSWNQAIGSGSGP